MATATDIVTAARSDQKANSYELIETLFFEDFFLKCTVIKLMVMMPQSLLV